jgi:hypothetical protein
MNPPKFKELNSELNREALEFGRGVREGTRTLGSDNNGYEPPSIEPELEAQGHVPRGIGTVPPHPANRLKNAGTDYLARRRARD